jgi:hypothetical protein
LAEVSVRITRYVDDHFPGFVECLLVDATGRQHLFVDKGPVFSLENLLPTTVYPRPGVIMCEVDADWRDPHDADLVRIDTEHPSGLESADGLTKFVVRRSELSSNGLS